MDQRESMNGAFAPAAAKEGNGTKEFDLLDP
jgi:hypothetical protein